MTKYVALLRGIGPGNPNMRGAKLKEVMEGLGFDNVQTLISSGNVLFESGSKDTAKLEAKIEKAWPEKLGFNSTTIIRSQDQLQKVAAANPFKKAEHNQKTYLLVTFFKQPLKTDLRFPHTPDGKTFTLLSADSQTLYSSVDLTGARTPDLMGWLEKQFGKDLTSRTWKTVNRILQKMD